jgi:L-lysine 2,3-aminomutase
MEPSPDDRLDALKALRDALVARGVPPEYVHLEALLEIETAVAEAMNDDDAG